MKMTLLHTSGRARTIHVVPHPTEASPFCFDRPIPVGASLHPATIEDAQAMIDYLHKVIEAMTLPPKGEQRGN